MRFPCAASRLAVVVSLAVAVPLFAAESTDTPAGLTQPLWAYGVSAPAKPGEKANPVWTAPSRRLRANEPEAEQTRPRRAAGSEQSFSLQDVRDLSNVVDWFPGDHPPMTDVMKHGPAKLRPNFGCASCHLPNGRGRPENAPAAGQPVAYLIRQLEDFRDGRRTSAEPRKTNALTMAGLTRGMTDAEIREAAEYFSATKWTTPWVRIVETDLVPRTRFANNLHVPLEEKRTEPIGARIVEVPENEEEVELLRNPRIGFIAYVPVGSVEKGRQLATTPGTVVVNGQTVPKTIACATCHGPDLLGLNDVPALAGRSPSYLGRQMYDFHAGARKGPAAALMQPVVANLTNDDLVALMAYVASLPPGKK